MKIPDQSGKADTGHVKAGNKFIETQSSLIYGICNMTRFNDILNSVGSYLISKKTSTEDINLDSVSYLQSMEDELELFKTIYNLKELKSAKSNESPLVPNSEEEKTLEEEMKEYKTDFYNMSVGSIRSIAANAQKILDALDNQTVVDNLTESWLQGKIAITEDYMRTIHDFVMFVSDASDSTSTGNGPGLWENIRRKKEKLGKKYKPAKPGDKDRPDPEQWKKLSK